MSSYPSADAKAVVRAAEALTTQVRRIADALETPVVRYEDATADATTPATECSAQHRAFEDRRQCIRAAQHRGDHVDERGYHWSDTVAVYPLPDSTVRIAHWHPASEQAAEERQELAGMVEAFVDAQMRMAPANGPDFTSPIAGRIEVRRPCPYCGDRQMIPTHQYDEHVARLHPDVRTGPAEHCEHDGPHPGFTCGEADQTRLFWEAQWARPSAQAADEEGQRAARRDSAAVLLARAVHGVLGPAEGAELREHFNAEQREADTARAEVKRWLAFIERGMDTHMQFSVIKPDGTMEELPCADWCYACRLEEAQAAIERVRVLVAGIAHPTSAGIREYDLGRQEMATAVVVALTESEQQEGAERG